MNDNRMTFTGKELDEETGLQYFGARYYDGFTGRWISRDPVVGSIKRPASLNRYIYAFNNPLNYIDPDGRASFIASAVAKAFAKALAKNTAKQTTKRANKRALEKFSKNVGKKDFKATKQVNEAKQQLNKAKDDLIQNTIKDGKAGIGKEVRTSTAVAAATVAAGGSELHAPTLDNSPSTSANTPKPTDKIDFPGADLGKDIVGGKTGKFIDEWINPMADVKSILNFLNSKGTGNRQGSKPRREQVKKK